MRTIKSHLPPISKSTTVPLHVNQFNQHKSTKSTNMIKRERAPCTHSSSLMSLLPRREPGKTPNKAPVDARHPAFCPSLPTHLPSLLDPSSVHQNVVYIHLYYFFHRRPARQLFLRTPRPHFSPYLSLPSLLHMARRRPSRRRPRAQRHVLSHRHVLRSPFCPHGPAQGLRRFRLCLVH